MASDENAEKKVPLLDISARCEAARHAIGNRPVKAAVVQCRKKLDDLAASPADADLQEQRIQLPARHVWIACRNRRPAAAASSWAARVASSTRTAGIGTAASSATPAAASGI